MAAFLAHLVATYGLAIVLLIVGLESLGLPVPGETVLVIAAAAAAKGHLAAWPIALAAWVGAVVGDNLGYAFGRRYGRRLTALPVLQRVYTPERLAAAERFFLRMGWTAVFFGRFVAVLRMLAGPLAGMHGMPWRRFMIANAAGAAIWVGAVTALGTLLGANLDRALRLVSRAGYVGLGLALLLILTVAAVRIARRRHSRNAVASEHG